MQAIGIGWLISFHSGMQKSSESRTEEDLDELVERQQATIDRLERKVDALANELDVGFAGQCSHCEEGVLQWSDGALVCSGCQFTHAV